MPNSPNSNVKKPKKLILIDDKINTVNGKINEMNIKTLLVRLSNSFCNSSCTKRIILGWCACVD